MKFGTPWHYDSSCSGTFTIQYSGRKHWSFYAPWEISSDLKVHDHYETIIGPGDILIYGPAWFHHTRVLENHGSSVAVAYYTGSIPFFSVHRNVSSLALSPLGFGACTGEGPAHITPSSGDWFERSIEWENEFNKSTNMHDGI